MMLLTIATTLQFLLLLGLALVVLSLARQVGILHERLSPAGMTRARTEIGPGEATVELDLAALSGAPVRLTGMPTALLFLSADCPICRSVLPAFGQSVSQGPFRAFWVADGMPGQDGQQPDYPAYAADRGLEPDRFLVSQTLGLTLGIRQIPALVLLDGEGRLISRDTVRGPREVESRLHDAASQLATPMGEKST